MACRESGLETFGTCVMERATFGLGYYGLALQGATQPTRNHTRLTLSSMGRFKLIWV